MQPFRIFDLLIYAVSQLAAATIELDHEHLSMYPYCGKLFGYEWHDATSRIVNSKESEIQYPWVVLVERFYMMVESAEDSDSEESDNSDADGNTEEYPEDQFCSGTVIGEK